MRRGYDPSYGSREQLKDSSDRNMKIARELDELKKKYDNLEGVNTELNWRVEELSERLDEAKALIKFLTEQDIKDRS